MLLDARLLDAPAPAAMQRLAKGNRSSEFVVVTQGGDAADSSLLIAAGAAAVLEAAVSDDALRASIRTQVDKRLAVLTDRVRLAQGPAATELSDFVSQSPVMQSFLAVAARVAAYDTSLLLLGETGSGKEHVARAIHAASPRAEAPFVAVNCAAMPEALLESELFGHERGAFTGAVHARRGYFELAHGGTIFLDEIGEMPAHLQVRLLRVLQDKRIKRLGAEREVAVDARVLAATNRDLEHEMAEKRFREDLYYRLSVVTLTVPSLRKRREDIRVLAEGFREKFRTQMGKPVQGISEDATGVLVGYAWPGNVRELMNVMERAVLLCLGDEIGVDDLPDKLVGATKVGVELAEELADAMDMSPVEGIQLDDSWIAKPLGEVKRAWTVMLERAYLDRLLTATRGRVTDAAKRAGIARRSLYAKMQALGLRKEGYKGRRNGDTGEG